MDAWKNGLRRIELAGSDAGTENGCFHAVLLRSGIESMGRPLGILSIDFLRAFGASAHEAGLVAFICIFLKMQRFGVCVWPYLNPPFPWQPCFIKERYQD